MPTGIAIGAPFGVSPGSGTGTGTGVSGGFQFYAPLTTTITPDTAVDSTVTPPGAATVRMVEDHEGILRRAAVGEIRFRGARRVENLIADSNDFTAASTDWVPVSCSQSGDREEFLIFTAVHTARIQQVVTGDYSGHTVTGSVYARCASGTETFRIQINLGTLNRSSDLTATTSWQRFSYTITETASSASNIAIMNGSDGSARTIEIKNVQLEETGGATDNTLPGEYVDSDTDYGVGNNVKGVKYYTTTNGNSVASNVVTEATGSAIAAATLKGYYAEPTIVNENSDLDFTTWTTSGPPVVTANADTSPDGRVDATTLQDDNASALEYIADFPSKAVANSETYTASIYIKKDAVAATTRFPIIRMAWQGGTQTFMEFGLDTSDGSVAKGVSIGSGTADSVHSELITLPSGDQWYRLVGTSTNDATGNNVLTVRVYPAWGANADLQTSSTAATGTITIWGHQLEQSSNVSTFYPVAGGTRAADNNLKYHIDNVPLAEHSSELYYTIPFTETLASTTSNLILSTNAANGRLMMYPNTAIGVQGKADGFTTAGVATITWAAGETLRYRVRLSVTDNVHNISHQNAAGTVEDDATPQTAAVGFTTGTNLFVLNGVQTNTDGSVGIGQSVKGLTLWPADKGDAWLNEV